LTLLGFAFAAGASSARAGYVVTPIGTLGGDTSTGYGINNAGQVAGSSYTSSGDIHAFLYSAGVMHDLGLAPWNWNEDSYATAINASGQVAGAAGGRAFLYSDGVMHDLGVLGGYSGFYSPTSSGAAINDAGEVVGYSQTDSGVIHAFLYSGGVMHDLGSPGGLESYALGVNNAGQVVGYVVSEGSVTTGMVYTGFVYSNGVMSYLDSLGGYSTTAFAINDAGQVVGWSSTSSDKYHAFLYSDGVMHDLGTLGGLESSARGINAAGQVVGVSETASGDDHGFLYANGQMTDLNDLLEPGSGWTITGATAIGPDGSIVALGRKGDSGEQTVILSSATTAVPEPSSVVLIGTSATAGLGLAIRRRAATRRG
jgi:probable HAF family extracellular repeat protein